MRREGLRARREGCYPIPTTGLPNPSTTKSKAKLSGPLSRAFIGGHLRGGQGTKSRERHPSRAKKNPSLSGGGGAKRSAGRGDKRRKKEG